MTPHASDASNARCIQRIANPDAKVLPQWVRDALRAHNDAVLLDRANDVEVLERVSPDNHAAGQSSNPRLVEMRFRGGGHHDR